MDEECQVIVEQLDKIMVEGKRGDYIMFKKVGKMV